MADGLTHLGVSGYRSLQQLSLPLAGLTVICGVNGCGKSNLHRSLGLLAAAARGGLVAALAAEGGLPAVLWAGPRRSGEARLRLGFAGSPLSYAIELGYQAEDQTSAFVLDPAIRREWIWAGGRSIPAACWCSARGRWWNGSTPMGVDRCCCRGRCRPTRACSPPFQIRWRRRRCSGCGRRS